MENITAIWAPLVAFLYSLHFLKINSGFLAFWFSGELFISQVLQVSNVASGKLFKNLNFERFGEWGLSLN